MSCPYCTYCTYCTDCPGRCVYQRCPFDPQFAREPDLLPASLTPIPTRWGLVLLVVWAVGMAIIAVKFA